MSLAAIRCCHEVIDQIVRFELKCISEMMRQMSKPKIPPTR